MKKIQRSYNRLGPRTWFVYLATLTASLWILVEAIDVQWVTTSVVAIISINFLGFLAAFVITYVLKFPTDGGYRDPEIRAEFGQDPVDLKSNAN